MTTVQSLLLAAASLVAAVTTAKSQPACTVATLGCYSDTPVLACRAVNNGNDAQLTLEYCASACALNGFATLAVTGDSKLKLASCCCGNEVAAGALRVDSDNGDGLCEGTTVHRLTCDGQAPAQPVVGALLPPGRACSQPQSKAWPFCNASLPLETRLQDLVSRISANVSSIGFQLTSRESPALPDLGIPGFYWGTNAIHGIAGDYCRPDGTCPTSWPDGVAMAASWNATSWELMGAVTGRELRALDNIEWSNQTAPAGGLTAWGPTINILRDPRWGRTQEAASECPYLAGRYGAAVSSGLQNGTDPRYLLAVATLKHFAAYSLEDYGPNNNHEWMRQTFNAVVSPFDLADTYFLPFQRAIQDGGAAGIMYAANELNGIPCAGDSYLDSVLHSWGFNGYRCTDGGQIINMVTGHKYVPTLDQAIGLAAIAESDIADGTEYATGLVHAINNGNTTLALAQRLLANIMRIRFRLGHFDPPDDQPYLLYNESNINDAEARSGTAIASREALVLLKNGNGTLPLLAASSSASRAVGTPAGKVAVIGPNCNSTVVLQGNYGGAFCPNGPHGPQTDCYPTIYTAIRSAYAPDAVYVLGSGINEPVAGPGGLADAVAAVRASDSVIMCLGLDQTQEGEQHDRYNITLPDAQMQLYYAVQNASAVANKPVIVVLVHGGALAIPDIASTATSIIDAFYPGVTAGPAIADAIFGVYNPGGKMPYTVYPPQYQFDYNFTHMDIANGSAVSSRVGSDSGATGSGTGTGGRTYRYYTGTPLWSFGYGLSYSNFSLAWAGTPPSPTVNLTLASPPLDLAVDITNEGPLDGDEVLQWYYTPIPGSFPSGTQPPFLPQKQLFGFQRVRISNGGVATVPLSISAADLQVTSGGDAPVRAPMTASYTITITRGHGEVLSFQINLDASTVAGVV